MARLTVQCDTCGSDMDFNTFGGNSRDRQWRADHFNHECNECKIKRVTLENEKNAERNREEGLPLLIGSEKQIAWAETIRATFIQKAEELMENAQKFYELLENSIEEDRKALAVTIMIDLGIIDPNLLNFFEENTLNKINFKITKFFENNSASFWIDRRGNDIIDFLEEIQSEEVMASKDLEAQLQKEAELEATIRPEIALSETVAYIFAENEEKLCIEFPEKRDDFRTLVKAHGFSWGNGRWYRKLSVITGTKEDRIAEMGNLLLTEGFVVRIFDEELRARAIEGIYEPEHTRWVKVYKGKFSIKWKRYTEDFYEEARKIPTSKWDNPTVDVKSEQFEAVEDFTNEYDFRFTPKAEELLEEARATKEAQLIPTVKKGKDSTKAPVVEKDFTPQEDGKIDATLLD